MYGSDFYLFFLVQFYGFAGPTMVQLGVQQVSPRLIVRSITMLSKFGLFLLTESSQALSESDESG